MRASLKPYICARQPRKLEKANTPVATATLNGPFRLKLQNGQDITPSSPLRQAILAVLICSPGQEKPRRSVRDMFWGSPDRDRTAANLRTALYLLKQDLRLLSKEPIRADRNVISLRQGLICSNRQLAERRPFLEGIDLDLPDCEGFEDWLREMRMTQETDWGRRTSVVTNPEIGKGATARNIALGFMPSLHACLARADLIRVDAVTDAVARNVSRTTSLDVHDLRGFDVQSVPLPIETGMGPTHLLQAVAENRGEKLLLTYRIHDCETRRIVWISDPIDARATEAEELAMVTTEAVLERLATCNVAADAPDFFPWTALTALFSLDDETIRRTEHQISQMIDQGAPKVLECLQLFAQIFKENEGFETPYTVPPDRLSDLLSDVPTHDPMLPLWRSLAGYSAHMLLSENELAELLLQSAYEAAPTLSLNLDHLAVLRMAKGDLAGAEAALLQCLRVGASSPWRYTYHVTGSMIAMAKGDYRQSLAHANRALMRKPRFIGALRYAMLGFALADNTNDAQRMQTRIRCLRPDYDFGSWTDAMIRRSPLQLGTKLAQGIQRAGIA